MESRFLIRGLVGGVDFSLPGFSIKAVRCGRKLARTTRMNNVLKIDT
jgi:hypothetical protein